MTTSDPTSRTHARSGADEADESRHLDALARKLHHESLGALSARTQAQLHQRRRAALRGDGAQRPGKWWPMLAITGTAAVALAVGVQFMRPAQTAPAPTVADGAATPSTGAVLDAQTAGTLPADRDTAQGAAPPPAAADDAALAARTSDDATGSDPATIGDAAVDNDDLDALLASTSAETAADASAQALPSDDALPDAELFAALEETPDFYLWLGSEENEASLSEAL